MKMCAADNPAAVAVFMSLFMFLDASNVRQEYGCMQDFVFCILACALEVLRHMVDAPCVRVGRTTRTAVI